ncbi:class I SAM-dependent methyltransferase [Asticcacaulis sp. EMRT-3]|uniref:class I SAM-dependent methyltransferase n=1 Tax=Asticcacaulis sp. EMRT-3 TaxID=3040349 RepID=UPI0024AF125A|nr:class I SAM-dependent methyltransferase [Asticcacaulis sp. EMRT-3]MDI7776210.1 class I SAM-dependent methyltransferase [Asticcacaulis sp. EMRT-3]
MMDPVIETLLLPFEDGSLDWPAQPTLFLRARVSDAPRDRLVCEQSFKPAHDALLRAGFKPADAGPGPCPLVLVLPPRAREEYRALLARAVRLAGTGGVVMAAAANHEGARTVENDLKALVGPVTSQSKHKCRVFWVTIDPAHVDQALLQQWAEGDAPRPIEDGRFISRPGLFAWDHIDPGSKLLSDHLPNNFKGRMADLGGGFGYLSDHVLTRNPAVSQMDVIEAEQRALDLARQNLAKFGERAAFFWHDATTPLPGQYDAIISNPPFHATDRADRHDIGKAFIRSAAAALKSGGQLWLVANRHLPYEETLDACFKNVAVSAQNNYYKVFRAVGPRSKPLS